MFEKKFIILFSIPVVVVTVVALAGIYKFNYLASQAGYDADGNPIVEPVVCDENLNRYPNEQAAIETGLDRSRYGATYCPEYKMHPSWDEDQDGLNDCYKTASCNPLADYMAAKPGTSPSVYFASMEKKWKDQNGMCANCTPENGFSRNGQLSNGPAISWMKIRLMLKNDLNENPPIYEVEGVFNREYNAAPEILGTRIRLDDDIYTIIFPASKSLEFEYKNKRGALSAYYEVTELE